MPDLPSDTGAGVLDARAATGAARPGRSRAKSAESRYDAVRRVLRAGGPVIVYQPQLSLSRLEVAGYEALSRFPSEPVQHPEHWYALAHRVGLGPALEAAGVANALAGWLPTMAGGSTVLAVNLSPSVLRSAALRAVLPDDLTGIEIELTEHEAVLDPEGLRREIDRLRERGARLAIDDVGAGHSGLRRIMELAPDSLKLDRHLVDGVSTNTAKAALIRAVVNFAGHIGATVCAEGVESVADLLKLADLDVAFAQGWAVGMPDRARLDADPLVVAACERSWHRVTAAPMAGPEPTGTLEDLLAQLADVRDLSGLAQIATAAPAVLGCDQAELSFLRDGGEVLESLVGGVGLPAGELSRLADFPATRRCLVERSIIPIYRGRLDDDPAERALLVELGFQSVLLVPVSSRGTAIGLLEFYLTEDVPWSRRQVRSARLLASVLGPLLAGLLADR